MVTAVCTYTGSAGVGKMGINDYIDLGPHDSTLNGARLLQLRTAAEVVNHMFLEDASSLIKCSTLRFWSDWAST